MQKLCNIRIIVLQLTMISLLVPTTAMAVELSPNDLSIAEIEEQLSKEIRESEKSNVSIINNQKLPTSLPSENKKNKQFSKEESIAYLKQNPVEFEKLLGQMLIIGQVKELKELLPVYKTIKNYDPSVIDWGNALILTQEGKLSEAVSAYRKLNAKLSNVDVLRFQMAMVLFHNGQYQASKSEFEKLRSGSINEIDVEAINEYLEAINEKNDWNFNANLSYVNDKNLTNAPEKGTKIFGADGSITEYGSESETGKGISFALSGDKEWIFDNKSFVSLGLESDGNYYWDNKKFNDLTTGASIGTGYKSATTKFEMGPYYNKRWYAGGTSSNTDKKLAAYNKTAGVKVSLSQWLSPNWMYQGFARYGKTKHEDTYSYSDATNQLYANTVMYYPNAKQNWSLGIDYSIKDAFAKENSFHRKGVRVGWGQNWPKGFATKVKLGYSERDYEAVDFFGIKRENKEYSTGISLWNRGFSVLGLTPRLNWNYYNVDSNSPFEEYDKDNATIEFTKNF